MVGRSITSTDGPTATTTTTTATSPFFLCLAGSNDDNAIGIGSTMNTTGSNNRTNSCGDAGAGCGGLSLLRRGHQQQQQQQQQQQPQQQQHAPHRQPVSNPEFVPLEEEEDVDKVLARDLYTMTLQEREKALHDIHGVADIMDETPQMVQSAKKMLQQELVRIGPRSTAYQRAVSQCPEYVESLHIIFLRRDGFDVTSAASRILSHFDMKLTLWGEATLGRDITLNDFNRHDMECLNEGFFQTLNCRDHAGRALFVKTWYHQKYHERENVWRSLWYHKMSAAHDEETQIKGIAAIIYNVCDNWMETFDHVLFQGVAKVREVLPIRDVAIHYCYTDPRFGAAVAFISRVFETDSRTRSRLHRGTHLEVQYDLLSYGIRNGSLPLNADGVLRKKEHMNFIKMRRAQEERIRRGEKDFQVIVVPSGKDVLFGRGKPVQSHPGNLRLAFLVEEQIGAYLKGNRQDKVAITNSVYQTMKMDSTRFLRQDDDSVYVEVDEKTAIDKIAHFFRNRKQSLPKTSVATQKTSLSTSSNNKRPTSAATKAIPAAAIVPAITTTTTTTTLPVQPQDEPAPVSEDEDNVEPEQWIPFQNLIMSMSSKRSRTS